MILIKYGAGAKLTYKFQCDDLMDRVKNGNITPEGVMFINDTSAFHFSSNGEDVSIVSQIKDQNFSVNKDIDSIVCRILGHNRFMSKPRFCIFETSLKMEFCPELIKWKIDCNMRSDIQSIYEPELCDNLIIQFDQFNGIYVCLHIFPCGKVRINCLPHQDRIKSVDDIDDMRLQALDAFELIKEEYFKE